MEKLSEQIKNILKGNIQIEENDLENLGIYENDFKEIDDFIKISKEWEVYVNKKDLTILCLVRIKNLLNNSDFGIELRKNPKIKAILIANDTSYHESDDYQYGYLMFIPNDKLIKIKSEDLKENSDVKKIIFNKLREKDLYKLIISFHEGNYEYKEEANEKLLNWLRSFVVTLSLSLPFSIHLYRENHSVNPINIEIDDETLFYIYLDKISLLFLENYNFLDFNHFKFLELYHILERFMVEEKRKISENIIREIANYYLLKKGGNIETLINKFKPLMNIKEEELLGKVIRNSISDEDLKNIYDSLSKDIKKSLNKIPQFLPQDDKVAQIKNFEDFKDRYHKRIYKIRNSIVHSKTEEGEEIFQSDNSEHQKELVCELETLIKIVLKVLLQKCKDNIITREIAK
ncbi:hypothetical protein [Persephonella sp.]